MTGGSVKMRINGTLFEVAICPERDEAVRFLASGQAFARAGRLHNAVDSVLGEGAFERIKKGRRVDIFDLITLAVYICAKYAKAKEAEN
ncbi:MAG: hypothetical protein ACOYID_05020 [Eubacteriales bacterium]|jgi:hypothetical protein|nr:hypothetical protein [Clostridiales bacterium]